MTQDNRLTRRTLILAAAAPVLAPAALRAETLAAIARPFRTGSEEARVAGLHDFVRDEIAFGWGPRFNDETPERTLARRRGFCQTKGALLTALLREADVDARLIFAEIDAGILDGLISPGTPMVDHAYVEARIDGEWTAFDSHIVHADLLRGARARLAAQGRSFGWGVHVDGTTDFPGFSQFAAPDVRGRVWGPYDGIPDFLANAPKVWNRIPALVRLGFGLLAGPANRRADALTDEGAALA